MTESHDSASTYITHTEARIPQDRTHSFGPFSIPSIAKDTLKRYNQAYDGNSCELPANEYQLNAREGVFIYNK